MRQIAQLKPEPQQRLIEVERERARSARELHDTVQQELGALPYMLETIEAEVKRTDQVATRFDACYRQLTKAALELKDSRHDISPSELWGGDVEGALHELLYRKQTAPGITWARHWAAVQRLDNAQATAL